MWAVRCWGAAALVATSACGGSVSTGRHADGDPAAHGGESGSGGTSLVSDASIGGGVAAGTAGSFGTGGLRGSGGATGTGGAVVFITGGSAGTVGPSPDACVAETWSNDALPLDIYVLLDQSDSMNCPWSNGTRWDAVTDALNTFARNAAMSGINVGLAYFGTAQSPPSSSCVPADYGPDVEIGTLTTNPSAIATSLAAHNPFTDTPTLPALEEAIVHTMTWKGQHPGHDVVVVLVTDGEPNACGANTVAQVVQVASQGYLGGGVQTYVVGLSSSGSTCALDPNPPNLVDLDSIASAGGTTKAIIVDMTSTNLDAASEFAAAMSQVARFGQNMCEFTLPVVPGSVIDPRLVNVQLKLQTEVGTLLFVDTVEKCDPSAGGWYYDVSQGGPAPAAPTKVILCPASCRTVTADLSASVSILVGCPTLLGP